MNRQVKVTWRTLRAIEHLLMVHARVLEAYIYFALMYMTDKKFPVLSIKYLIKKTARRPHHLNLQQVRNLQYHIYACYFFHVLYKNLLHTLVKRRYICVTKCKSFFVVSLLVFHSIKNVILCTLHAQGL